MNRPFSKPRLHQKQEETQVFAKKQSMNFEIKPIKTDLCKDFLIKTGEINLSMINQMKNFMEMRMNYK